MKILTCLALLLISTATAAAAPPPLKPDLQGLGFLIGRWSTPARGKVAETSGFSTGETSFTPEASGSVLLRRDHVHLFDARGAAVGGFDILMMIYADGGALRAEYADGDHLIHYTSAALEPGRSVTFTSAPSPTAPSFRLAYVLSRPDVLDIAFTMAPPGSTTFRPIATGSVTRAP